MCPVGNMKIPNNMGMGNHCNIGTYVRGMREEMRVIIRILTVIIIMCLLSTNCSEVSSLLHTHILQCLIPPCSPNAHNVPAYVHNSVTCLHVSSAVNTHIRELETYTVFNMG